MNNAQRMAAAQRTADIAHHTLRLQWLEAPIPVWSDGTPLTQTDRATLLRQSRTYLANIDGGGCNHCHCVPRCSLPITKETL